MNNESQNTSGSLGCLAGIDMSTRLAKLSTEANEYLKLIVADTTNHAGQVFSGLQFLFGLPDNALNLTQAIYRKFSDVESVLWNVREFATVVLKNGKRYVPILDAKRERVECLVRQKKAGVFRWISTLGKMPLGSTYVDRTDTIYPKGTEFLKIH